MSSTTPVNRQEVAKHLAEGYTWKKRLVEIISIIAFAITWSYVFIRVSRFFVHSSEASLPSLLFAGVSVFLGLLLGDFFSGVAHWGLDTWGSETTPVFGVLIRAFREHHVDQTAITRHDFIETNGDNCTPPAPILAALCFTADLGVWGSVPWYRSVEFQSLILAMTFAVAATNQFHKWSHDRKIPAAVKWLMDNGVILSAQSHRIHHSGQFEKSYCITTGWLNPPLDAIHFWRGLEFVITKLTGEIPRKNDLELLGQ